MAETIAVLYFWLKSAHLIFVIFWMAGLFMLPRFFVYHQESAEGSEEAARWVERERRLLKIILNPSMVIVWVLGLLLAWHISAFSEGWMAGYARKLSTGERPLAGKTLRILNEVPGIAAALIVILVVIKPF